MQSFISRFSANKSKAKQATARRKLLDKLTVEELPVSSRKYPYLGFEMDREPGKEILFVENISKEVDGKKLLNNVSKNNNYFTIREVCFTTYLLIFLLFWTDLTTWRPRLYKNKCLSLHKKSVSQHNYQNYGQHAHIYPSPSLCILHHGWYIGRDVSWTTDINHQHNWEFAIRRRRCE